METKENASGVKIKLDIEGRIYDAEIRDITPNWSRHRLSVYIDFNQDDHPGRMLGLFVEVPAEEYKRDELLLLIKVRAERKAEEILEDDRKEAIAREMASKRVDALKSLCNRLMDSLRGGND